MIVLEVSPSSFVTGNQPHFFIRQEVGWEYSHSGSDSEEKRPNSSAKISALPLQPTDIQSHFLSNSQYIQKLFEIEIFTEATMKNTVFWNETVCGLIEVTCVLDETCLHLQG
jgi:hypothetical protein